MSCIVSTYMFRSLVWPSSVFNSTNLKSTTETIQNANPFPQDAVRYKSNRNPLRSFKYFITPETQGTKYQWRKVTCKKNCTLACCLMYLAPQRYGFHMRGICPPGSAPEEGIPYFVFKYIQGGAKINDTIDMLNSESRVASGTLYINPASILSV